MIVIGGIIGGVFEYNMPLFSDGKVENKTMTFDDMKDRIFGSENEVSFMEFMKTLFETRGGGDGQGVTENMLNTDEETAQELSDEIFDLFMKLPRKEMIGLFMACRENNEERFNDELKEERDANVIISNLFDMYKKVKGILIPQEIHRSSVLTILGNRYMQSDSVSFSHYFHHYLSVLEMGSKGISTEMLKDFFVFMSWYGNHIYGTLKPSRYAGQEFDTGSYRRFYDVCIESLNRYDDGDDYEDFDYENDPDVGDNVDEE